MVDRRWARAGIATGIAVAVTLIVATLVFAVRGGIDGSAEEPPTPTPTASRTPTATASPTSTATLTSTPTPVATATPVPPPTSTPVPRVERLVIPKIGVNAGVIVFGVDDHGFMETPPDAWSIAWYDFSARPGTGGNAVFSGNMLWFTGSAPGPAIFMDLRRLQRGDIVIVALVDGSEIQYAVTSTQAIGPDDPDVDAVIGPTAQDQITLITGQRLGPGAGHTVWVVVRAERR